MSQKICVTSWASMGCTFIDWSIHFLSGQHRYYNAELDEFVELSHNPITKTNAHGHNKNHPSGFNDTKHCLENFDKLPDNAMCSMYPTPLLLDVAANIINITVDQLHNFNSFKQVQKVIVDDYNKIFDLCQETDTKIIFVAQDSRVALYHHSARALDRFITRPGKPESEQDLINEIQQVFFKNSISSWEEINLTNVWDLRERMALDLRPFESIETNVKIQTPHHWINCLTLWTQTEKAIKDIMKYLEIDINSNRFNQWLPICQQWQKIQLTALDFSYSQPHIVEAIVNNWYYEIDLTFQQEVVIQHCLIYQHNLNLKTWKLEKFPSNTQDLHKLLEPNIHTVPKIY